MRCPPGRFNPAEMHRRSTSESVNSCASGSRGFWLPRQSQQRPATACPRAPVYATRSRTVRPGLGRLQVAGRTSCASRYLRGAPATSSHSAHQGTTCRRCAITEEKPPAAASLCAEVRPRERLAAAAGGAGGSSTYTWHASGVRLLPLDRLLIRKPCGLARPARLPRTRGSCRGVRFNPDARCQP